MVGSFTIGRRIPDTEKITPDESGALPSRDMTFVLSAQCKDGGAIKWIDGPYSCTGSNCLRLVFELVPRRSIVSAVWDAILKPNEQRIYSN